MLEEKTVIYLTDKDEEFVRILTKVGTHRNVAKVLVFLANTAKATQQTIERGLDLRQPEVSIALRYMTEQGWVTSAKVPSEKKGRPVNQVALALPIRQILASIEKATQARADEQLALVKRAGSFV